MITWRAPLYTTESTKGKKRNIMSGIRQHKFQLGVYVVVLSLNGTDIFDLIPAYMLSKDSYKGSDIKILGIASGKKDAMELAAQMIMDVYARTGELDVRGYFS